MGLGGSSIDHANAAPQFGAIIVEWLGGRGQLLALFGLGKVLKPVIQCVMAQSGCAVLPRL